MPSLGGAGAPQSLRLQQCSAPCVCTPDHTVFFSWSCPSPQTHDVPRSLSMHSQPTYLNRHTKLGWRQPQWCMPCLTASPGHPLAPTNGTSPDGSSDKGSRLCSGGFPSKAGNAWHNSSLHPQMTPVRAAAKLLPGSLLPCCYGSGRPRQVFVTT